MYNFKEVLDRKHNSYKVSQMVNNKHYVDDPLTLAYTVADMDFPIMPEVREAIIKYMDENTFGYTFPTDSYYDELTNFFKRNHNFEFTRKDVIPFTGVLAMIEAILRAFTDEDDEVVILTPVYTPFYRLINNNNRSLVNCPLVLDGVHYSIDFELLDKVTQSDKCKILLFCSPHNPVGRVWTKDELQRVADICLKNDVLIISDEIHCDFDTNENQQTMLATLSDEVSDITFTCTSPSKTFNLASLNVSNLIVKNPKLLGQLSNYLGKQAHNSVNALGLAACEAAYKYGDTWVKQLNELLVTNTKILTAGLSKHESIKVIPRQGTYLVWIDMRNVYSETLNDVLKECGIYCVCGQDYGENGKGFVRVNVACPTKYIEVLVERFDHLMRKLNVSRETIYNE